MTRISNKQTRSNTIARIPWTKWQTMIKNTMTENKTNEYQKLEWKQNFYALDKDPLKYRQNKSFVNKIDSQSV